ncbi:MAG: ABC transporter ATP-binding protein [Methanomicrobiales archaeon]|nr:ABC transporter ATP-binding protein [Methanomicrobiales archaeon]NYT20821.1 ABC transporter ATP-binding protein [Methanomicrobiales archaeon]
MESVIEVRDVSCRLGGRTVLDHVNLTVRKGDLYAIIGPNGGGKTTLLRAILGLQEVDSGEVRLFGQAPREGRTRVGYVPQFRTFDFNYPVTVGNMVLSGRLGQIPGPVRRYSAEDHAAVIRALDRTGIGHLGGRELRGLSGGERQRAIIARALVGEPDLLILDEALVYVDIPTEAQLFDLLEELKKSMTILMATHDIGAISTHITCVACLNERLFTHGTSEITEDMLTAAYHCPVDLIAHGIPHRVLREHEREP